jgi:hypothetical protein
MAMRRFTRLTNGLLEKAGKSAPRGSVTLHALQLLPHSQNAARNACNGSRLDRSRLGTIGTG